MKNFVLRCVKKSHPDIDLPDFLPVIIGRNRQTEITNSRLSRHHVKLTANVSKKQVLCQIIGPNGSKLNGEKVLQKNEKVVLKSGDKIELLEGLYEHLIVLEQAQEENLPKNSMVQIHLPVFFCCSNFFCKIIFLLIYYHPWAISMTYSLLFTNVLRHF